MKDLKKRLDLAYKLKEDNKRLTDNLIEYTELWKILDKDFTIAVKSNTETVEITDPYLIKKIVETVRPIIQNPFTAQGHTYPARKRGGQEGTIINNIYRDAANELFTELRPQHKTDKQTFIEIQRQFAEAGHDKSYESIKKYIKGKTNP